MIACFINIILDILNDFFGNIVVSCYVLGDFGAEFYRFLVTFRSLFGAKIDPRKSNLASMGAPKSDVDKKCPKVTKMNPKRGPKGVPRACNARTTNGDELAGVGREKVNPPPGTGV